jgi:hypothetical protein
VTIGRLLGFHGLLGIAVLSTLVATPAKASYTIIALPDTQNYSTTSPIPPKQTQWIVDQLALRNIRFVTHLGDVVDQGDNTAAWQRMSDVLGALDPHVPYSVVRGNHDADPPSLWACPCQAFLGWFGEARYLGFDWYGGSDPNPDRPSFYQFFEADGVRFLHLGIALQYTSDGVVEWAQGVIDAHPGLPVIVTTHAYLDVGGRSPNGEILWEQLIASNRGIWMVLNGHYKEPTNPPGDAEFHQVSVNDAGLPVIEMLANYQQRTFGGGGWMRIIEVDPDADEVRFSTYSPHYDAFEQDPESEFDIAFDLDPRLRACNDGRDNDLDGKTDFPDDTECESYAGVSEVATVPTLPADGLVLIALALIGVAYARRRRRSAG